MKNLIGRLVTLFSLGLSLTLILLWMLNLGIAPVAYAANFTVTRTDDPVPNGCNPGDCSLREAIIAANANTGTDTIVLSSATYNLTRPGTSEDAALTGDLDITDTLTISGTGSTVIDGGNIDRVFHLLGGNFTLSGVTVENGSTSSGGGGLYIDYDVTTTVRIIESTFLNNTAGFGGGLANFGLTTTIVISNSAFINNSATGRTQGYGGGILDFLGFHPYDIVGSSFISNTAAVDGGAFDFSSLGGQINITNTTISGNSAGDNGGGINSSNSSKSINLNNVTIFGNTADSIADSIGEGGGIYRSMGTYNIANTIIAGNSDNSLFGIQSPDCYGEAGSIVSAGYNLIGKTDGCNWVSAAGDITGTITSSIDPKLGPLTGLPAYQPLLNNSPAIDAGNPAVVGGAFPACMATDQQGRIRPLDGNGDSTTRCDIGAYELDITPPIFPNTDPNTGTALITPTLGVTLSTHRPVFDWHNAVDDGGVVSYTLIVTSSGSTIFLQEASISVTTTQSIFIPTVDLPDAVYTWTVQAYDLTGNSSSFITPQSFVIKSSANVFLPLIVKN